MTEATPPIRLLRTQAEMVQAYRDRIRELGLTHETVDAISGLPSGYTSKLMCEPPIKNLGQKAIELLNGALGIAFVAMVDSEAARVVRSRWTRRRRPLAGHTASIPASIENPTATEIQITAELQAQIATQQHMKRIAKMGAKRRNMVMKKRARQRAASHAARMRWARKSETRRTP